MTFSDVADAYRKAGPGAAGNAVVFDAFGRAGLSMIPLLEQEAATFGLSEGGDSP